MKFLDLGIIKLLKENEYSFCKSINSYCFSTDRTFFTFYNSIFDDDYFFNRTIIDEANIFKINTNELFEKKLKTLTKVLEEKKITMNLHISSDNILLKNFLIKKNFKQIDKVLGLQYPFILKKKFLNVDDRCYIKHDYDFCIFVLDSPDLLKEWMDAYCSSFAICFEKKLSIYNIFKKKFDFFYFILYKTSSIDNKPFGESAGCCLLYPYKESIALYCLGTIKEYRNRHIATKIIDFAINFAQRKGYNTFGLQTLQSDNLLSFYGKKGFVEIYGNVIYRQIINR